jgi:hypothetical protein
LREGAAENKLRDAAFFYFGRKNEPKNDEVILSVQFMELHNEAFRDLYRHLLFL